MFERLQLEDDEQIVGVIRRHWFFLFLQCISVIVLMLIPLCGLFALSVFAPDALRICTIPLLFACALALDQLDDARTHLDRPLP